MIIKKMREVLAKLKYYNDDAEIYFKEGFEGWYVILEYEGNREVFTVDEILRGD